jgi:hypothetical protein
VPGACRAGASGVYRAGGALGPRKSSRASPSLRRRRGGERRGAPRRQEARARDVEERRTPARRLRRDVFGRKCVLRRLCRRRIRVTGAFLGSACLCGASSPCRRRATYLLRRQSLFASASSTAGTSLFRVCLLGVVFHPGCGQIRVGRCRACRRHKASRAAARGPWPSARVGSTLR